MYMYMYMYIAEAQITQVTLTIKFSLSGGYVSKDISHFITTMHAFTI